MGTLSQTKRESIPK